MMSAVLLLAATAALVAGAAAPPAPTPDPYASQLNTTHLLVVLSSTTLDDMAAVDLQYSPFMVGLCRLAAAHSPLGACAPGSSRFPQSNVPSALTAVVTLRRFRSGQYVIPYGTGSYAVALVHSGTRRSADHFLFAANNGSLAGADVEWAKPIPNLYAVYSPEGGIELGEQNTQISLGWHVMLATGTVLIFALIGVFTVRQRNDDDAATQKAAAGDDDGDEAAGRAAGSPGGAPPMNNSFDSTAGGLMRSSSTLIPGFTNASFAGRAAESPQRPTATARSMALSAHAARWEDADHAAAMDGLLARQRRDDAVAADRVGPTELQVRPAMSPDAVHAVLACDPAFVMPTVGGMSTVRRTFLTRKMKREAAAAAALRRQQETAEESWEPAAAAAAAAADDDDDDEEDATFIMPGESAAEGDRDAAVRKAAVIGQPVGLQARRIAAQFTAMHLADAAAPTTTARFGVQAGSRFSGGHAALVDQRRERFKSAFGVIDEAADAAGAYSPDASPERTEDEETAFQKAVAVVIDEGDL
jgi:hypothetical protein